MFTHQDLARLGATKKYPRILSDIWEKRTGENPFCVANLITYDQREAKKRWGLSLLCNGIGIIATLPIYGILDESIVTILQWVGFTLLAFGYIMLITLHTDLFHPRRFTDAEWDFPRHYGQLLNWSGMTSEGLAQLTESELRRIAKTILIRTARDTLLASNGHEISRRDEEFKDRYQILNRLGLVDGPFKPFYDEARRQLDGKPNQTQEKPMTPKSTASTSGNWRLEGYDTFEGGDAFYPLEGSYNSEADAEIAARNRLNHLEETQPAKSSGGQGLYGIQDHVYIVSPDGKRRHFLG